MERTSRRYARLLKAQTSIREREKVLLEAARHDLAVLEKDSHDLFSLMQQGSNADFVDPLLLFRRLERNRRAEAILRVRIDEMAGAALQAVRRCDILQARQQEALARKERQKLSDMLEEFIARQCL